MITAIVIGIETVMLVALTVIICRKMATKDDHQPPAEPVKLLTVGASVMWQGDEFEIVKFAVSKDNQTIATITNDIATLLVPIEELEGVTE